jgi:hypothetical protein
VVRERRPRRQHFRCTTGIPRTIVDIEKAAKLTVRENGKQFCNAQWKPFEGVNVEGYSLETASPDTDYPEAGTAA